MSVTDVDAGDVVGLAAAVQGLLDREAVRATLYRYASTIDVKDWAGLREVFTDDAVITMVGGARTEGRDAIAEYIAHRCRNRDWQHHMLSVHEVAIDGLTATALTYHTSHQTTRGRPDRILQLVARYRDRLRKDAGRWRIIEKTMELGWFEERARQLMGDLMEPTTDQEGTP